MAATAHAGGFEVTLRWTEGYVVLALAGELDIATARSLRMSLVRAVELRRPLLIVDLHEVTFIAAAGLGPLSTGARLMAERGGRLVLVRARPAIERIIGIAGLQDRIEVHGSIAEALAAARHRAVVPHVPTASPSHQRRVARMLGGSASGPILQPARRGPRHTPRGPRSGV